MNDKDLTPRVLAGLALGEDPAKFMSFRLMPDGSVVVIDPVGRKFILSDADLTRVYAEVVERRLKARGKALVEELKKEAVEISSAPAPASVKLDRKPATGKTPAHSGAKKTRPAAAKSKTAAAPKAAPKPKTKPA